MRDYAAEMRRIIDAETASGPYVSRVVAEHVVDKLRATDPELLEGWLYAQAHVFVWQMINDRDRSTRSRARATSKARRFAGDAQDAAGGDSTSLVAWLTVPFTVADGTRRRLGDMRGDDVVFVAEAYDARANQNKLTAAFLRVIARKVGNDPVRDHFTDEQLSTMWRSLSER